MTHNEVTLDAGVVFTPGTVDADGFTVRYEVAGEGPDLIALHGAGGFSHGSGGFTHSRGIDLLTAGNRVYLVELPGFGQERNERTADGRDMARTVLAIADALGLAEFALLGTSMGGVVASWAAVLAPRRLTRLVLEVPGAFRPDGSDPSKLSPEQMARAFHAHPERKTIVPADPAHIAAIWPLVERIMGPLHDIDLERSLADVHTPTLVLTGTADGLFGTEVGRTYRRIMPNATFAIVYDAAHDLSGDRPEAFAAIVGDFLQRGSEFVIEDRSTLIYP
ncbi:alpha/beta fold hydrolase [Microbacterium hominis]|uniref:alpha/beta fold hydrolase n=1 Tax=Microbacterium hominis TaxID=162426 RepID=UPI0007689433|nr:alpha/beta hydrolase [Microbacterium hominis]KXC06263.1 hypothetical protein MhomT_06535 [Microbacterium hominis]